MEINSHPNLAAAYRQGLLDLLQDGQAVPSVMDPTSPASSFGNADRPSIEILGYSFEVKNPYACLVDSEARPLRLPYCIGSFLWTLAGSNDLEHLQSYHPDARNFSDDGISLSGAFGKRLFRYHNEIDQISAIVERLQSDPTSRRTFAAICDADDNVRRSREYPCSIGIQYFLREGLLHTISYMRAQHALLILPYDAFLFMGLQCLVAARLGVAVGTYRHFCGTFHIYEAERKFAERVLSAPLRSIEFGRADGSKAETQDILQFEERARFIGHERDTRSLLDMIKVAETGSEFARLSKLIVLAHWLYIVSKEQDNVALKLLPELMQTMMLRQWHTTSKITA